MSRSEYSANRALAASRVLDYSRVDFAAPRQAPRPARRAVKVPSWAVIAAAGLLAALPVLARAL